MDKLFSAEAPTRAMLANGALSDCLPHLDHVVNGMISQGFAVPRLREQVRFLARFGQWLSVAGPLTVRVIDAQLAKFIAVQPGRRQKGLSGVVRQLVSRLVDVQLLEGVRANEGYQGPIDAILARFGHYLTQERGLAEATRKSYIQFVCPFLREQTDETAPRLGTISARNAIEFVRRHARDGAPRSAQTMTTALRSFFRFLVWEGILDHDIAAAVPTVAKWKLQDVPKGIPPSDVERMLQNCDLASAAGLRDHAILTLLARLGLRAGDIVALELDDIDWDAGEIRLSGKSRRVHKLPLPQDVGAAIAVYLEKSRPLHTSSRRVFLRAYPPFQQLASSVAVCSIIRRALRRAGLNPARRGAHILRHSLATRMLKGGASLSEIGQVLRHQREDTTTIYAKVDVEALRSLAPCWPGGAA